MIIGDDIRTTNKSSPWSWSKDQGLPTLEKQPAPKDRLLNQGTIEQQITTTPKQPSCSKQRAW